MDAHAGGRRVAWSSFLVVLGVLAAVLACALPSCNGATSAHLALCAVDAPQASTCDSAQLQASTVVTGDMRQQHETQVVRVLALQSDGHTPLTSTALTIAVHGANHQQLSATTGSDGIAEVSYHGDQVGTDVITAAPPSNIAFHASHALVVHWLAPHSFLQPIIFLHGINEDANVIAAHQEWTALFEALTITFDPNAVETFCYADDRAYHDATQPAHCTPPGFSACTANCTSQGGVDPDAVYLAARVTDLYTRTGKPVTLMGYSMGTAIMRTMLAGCISSPEDMGMCQTAASEVNQAFFLNGVQQGSWLMTVKQGLDAAALSGDGIPNSGSSPFSSVMPDLEQGIFTAVKDKMGLDANSPAAADLTPGSTNIVGHNSVPMPPNVSAYDFYGDIQLQIGVNEYLYPAKGQTPLPLGDLVLLAQSDDPMATPPWGGASLCGSCGPLSLGYHTSQSGQQYHAWALTDHVAVNVADIVPGVGPSFKNVLAAPENHLSISQPIAQAPGSTIQVQDITHLAGSQTTDMAYEITLILMQNDGIA
jgi:hypothetical protein